LRPLAGAREVAMLKRPGAFLTALILGMAVEGAPAARPRALKIAMIAKSEANFVFLSARKGAEDAAAALSRTHNADIDVLWLTPPREDAEMQAQRVAQAVSEGANAILIACSDARPLVPAIDAAVAKGVDVMTFDSDAPASKRFTFYGPDDADVGEKLAADLATLIGGKGKIAILAGNPNAPNLKARSAGVSAGAAKRGLEVVQVVHHAETPQDAATAVIQTNAAHPDLAGWAMVGGWPLFRSGQTPALNADLQKRKLKIVAVDGLPDQLIYVDRDLVPILWAQPTYQWGEVGVTTIVDKLLLGKKVAPKIRMELVRVSRQNLGDWSRRLKSWGFTGIPDEYLKRN
jgi:ribose transport system substrate-binding protein